MGHSNPPLSFSFVIFLQEESTLSFPNALEQFRLTLPATPSAGTPKSTFVRYLYGFEIDVEKIRVADGRCVSLSLGDNIWFWDLGGDRRGQRVQSSRCAQVEIGDNPSWEGEVELWRFDV